MAQWEGFEFEKAIFYGVNSCHFRLSAPFLRYIASFCTLPHIRLKGENKGEKSGHLPPPAAGVAEIRRTSSGAAAPCGRPGGLLQPPGVTEVRRTHGCAAASWASRRPPSAHARHRAGARRRDCPGPPRVAEKPALAVFRRGVGRETLRHSLQCCAAAWSSCVRIGHAVSPDSKKGHTTKTPAGILSQIAVTIAAMTAPPVRRAVRARAVLIYFMLACGRHPGKPFRRVSLCPFLKLYLTTSKKQGVRLAVLLILHPGNWPGLCT